MIETDVESLYQRLVQRIRVEGPITFAAWMDAALYDPAEGYYRRGDLKRWGRTGDYRTSPERSSLFPATFARYFARLYDEMGQPPQWTILEAGSGAGHFASGVLQTLSQHFPEVFAATRYVINDVSLNAQQLCREMTSAFGPRVEFGELGSVAVERGVIFSNELLDAFPVHRVACSHGELQEFFVSVDSEGRFELTLRPPSTSRLQEYLDLCQIHLVEGQIAEINLNIADWFTKVAASLKSGYVVTVDYGVSAQELHSALPSDARFLGTLRAFQRHTLAEHLLADPGSKDLTATVNWTFVEKVGQLLQLEVVDFKSQDKFLLDEGLLSQLESETKACSESEKLRMSTAAREMILPGGMATNFQVMIQRKVA